MIGILIWFLIRIIILNSFLLTIDYDGDFLANNMDRNHINLDGNKNGDCNDDCSNVDWNLGFLFSNEKFS